MDIAHVKTVLTGKGYVIGDKISAGSFATVRNVLHKESGSVFAIKMIDRSSAPEDFVKKFLPKELDVIRKLSHKYIVATKEILNVGWFTCIIMEKAQGGDLLTFVSKRGSLTEDIARPMFLQMMEGLKFIHEQNVAHRDIKCENILLSKNFTVKYADFGFARFVVNPKTNARELSETYCGSAAYAAPEVLKGRPYNPMMSDVWSLGIVLYIMICGIMPFDDGDHAKLLRNQLEKRWSWHPDKKGKITVSLRRVVKAMLEPDLTMRAPLRRLLQSDWLQKAQEDAKPAKKKTVLDILKSTVKGRDSVGNSSKGAS